MTTPSVLSPSSSVTSFTALPSPRYSTSSHATAADPHFPPLPPLPDISPSQLEEERLANERERLKLARKRHRILSPSPSLYSSFLSLPSPIKTLSTSPLAELEGLGKLESKAKRRRRRRHKSTTKGKKWESNDLDTLPSFHSSLLYYLSPSLLQRLLSHFIFSIIVLILTLVLAVLLILRIVYDSHDAPLLALAVIILSFFACEILLRLLAYGRSFYRHPWFLLSSVLTVLSFLFILNAFGISIVVNNTIALILQSVYSLLRFTSISFTLTSSARRMVSTNKTRYTQHGFDLDLTYITPRVIAMGLPSTSIEGLYRNPIDEVARFFNTLHPSHYLIINLCSERKYDADLFEGRVLCFPFDDHNPPPMSTIVEFCTTIDRFLGEDDRNVVACHCKGGKGRTGTMIACWLLYASMGVEGDEGVSEGSLFAEEAMKLFARSRTEKGIGGKVQGVSGPSQKRYVHYFEQLRWRMMKEEEAVNKREEERREKRRRKKSREVEQVSAEEESKEPYHSHTTTVSPISPSSSHFSYTHKPTFTSIPTPLEEKESHDPPSPSPPCSPPLTPSSSPSPSPSPAPRKDSRLRRREFLSSASSWLYHRPKCEVLSLVLNNAYINKEKEALMYGDERSRDEWNDTWNHRENWSLVITHYRPILPRSQEEEEEEETDNDRINEKATEEEKRQNDDEPPSHSITIHPPPRPRPLRRLTPLLSDLNQYNLHRYEDVHEYYFSARPKLSGDDDTSVTFDISSFEANSKSLILSGDLKFQIYRGRMDVGGEDEEEGTTQGGMKQGEENPQRKVSRALVNPLAGPPRLFGWFWLNTAFLPSTPPAPVGGGAPPPSELILRKNQLDESFQASDIDSEFNVYLNYYTPPVHQEAVQIEELHRGQMMRLKKIEEERRKKEREERRRKEGKGKDGGKDGGGKKKGGGEMEMVEVKTGGGASGLGFGELKDEAVYEEQEEKSGKEVSRAGSSRKSVVDEDDDDDEDEGSTDEDEEEVEEEEAAVEAEVELTDFAA